MRKITKIMAQVLNIAVRIRPCSVSITSYGNRKKVKSKKSKVQKVTKYIIQKFTLNAKATGWCCPCPIRHIYQQVKP